MRYQVGSFRALIIPRFEKFVSKTDGCWRWAATVDRRGYGKFAVFGSPRAAHQVSWVLYRGYLPEGQFVLHRCDNPSCVNPDHLFLGTHTDNMRDMRAKGRGPNRRGENSATAILSEQQVLAVYSRAWAGERPIDLAREYGVGPTTISGIKHGENWAYLTGHKRPENGVQFQDLRAVA